LYLYRDVSNKLYYNRWLRFSSTKNCPIWADRVGKFYWRWSNRLWHIVKNRWIHTQKIYKSTNSGLSNFKELDNTRGIVGRFRTSLDGYQHHCGSRQLLSCHKQAASSLKLAGQQCALWSGKNKKFTIYHYKSCFY